MRIYQVEQEHEEQMRMLKQRKKKEATPPPPPKTITVMAGKYEAKFQNTIQHIIFLLILIYKHHTGQIYFGLGSQHRAAWPIAPGGSGATVPVKVELTSASVEYEEEMMKNRFEVAQVFRKNMIIGIMISLV